MNSTRGKVFIYYVLVVLAVCVALEAYPQPISHNRPAPENTENLDEIYDFLNYYKTLLETRDAYRSNNVDGNRLDHMALKRGSNSRPVGTLGLLELLRHEMEEVNTRDRVSDQRDEMDRVGR